MYYIATCCAPGVFEAILLYDALMSWQPFWLQVLIKLLDLKMAGKKHEPIVVPPRCDKPFPVVVLPRSWSARHLQPWAAKPAPKPPTTPVPKHLLQTRLLKCLANVYNLGKMEDAPSMIAHAREAMSLKMELQTYLKVQQQHGPVKFPKVEAVLIINDLGAILLSMLWASFQTRHFVILCTIHDDSIVTVFGPGFVGSLRTVWLFSTSLKFLIFICVGLNIFC